MSNLYVSGSYLVWGSRPYTFEPTASYRFLGGRSSDFASQPVGKVWISSANAHLFYTDSGSQVRIIPGVSLGVSSTRPDGTIWIDRFPCPTQSSADNMQQLVWVYGGKTYGATGEKAYCAKGGRDFGTASFSFIRGTSTSSYWQLSMPTGSEGQAPLCSGMRIGVSSYFVLDYFTTTNCTGASASIGYSNIQLPNSVNGSYLVTASITSIPTSASSYRFRSESAQIGVRSNVGSVETRTTGSSFCLNGSNDNVTINTNWVVGNCVQFLT
jgi:hypothetical protein